MALLRRVWQQPRLHYVLTHDGEGGREGVGVGWASAAAFSRPFCSESRLSVLSLLLGGRSVWEGDGLCALQPSVFYALLCYV